MVCVIKHIPCTKFDANETEKVDKYISGLLDNIYGNVKSARPKTLDETIELANDLMDQKLHTYAERKSDNKRKADDSTKNNHGHQQQPFKRQNVANSTNGDLRKESLWVIFSQKCTKCHFTTMAHAPRGNGALPKGNGLFLSVEHQGVSRGIVLSLRIRMRNGMHKARFYALECRKERKCTRKP
ncbi:hypothetical protein Tco_0532723 [Tanacetum coccineum]